MEKQKFESQAPNHRRQIEHYLVGKKSWKFYSSVIYNHWQAVFCETIPKYKLGSVLDVGCGNAPYLSEIQKYSEEIYLMDYMEKDNPVSFLGNVQKMPVNNACFDSILCFQVFEHISDPFIAIKEITRILKPNGLLFFSVPHLSRLHEVPFDFYRYTKYGIEHLLISSGFEILELKETDGLISFLGHQISSTFLLSTWKIKFLRSIFLFINKYIFTLFISYLDKWLNTNKYFPQGYVAVARKK